MLFASDQSLFGSASSKAFVYPLLATALLLTEPLPLQDFRPIVHNWRPAEPHLNASIAGDSRSKQQINVGISQMK